MDKLSGVPGLVKVALIISAILAWPSFCILIGALIDPIVGVVAFFVMTFMAYVVFTSL